MKILKTASVGSNFTGSYKKDCILKKAPTQVFSYEFCEFLKKTSGRWLHLNGEGS